MATLLICFTLNLKYASSSAYHLVRDYTGWVAMKDWVRVAVVQQPKTSIQFDEMKHFEKQFALAMDKMKVWSGLVFKDTNELTRFCNLGEVNQDLESLTCNATASATPALVEQTLVLMIWAIFKPSFSFLVAMYPSGALTGENLYPVVWEVIKALELHSIPILSLTSDGNSPNQRFYHLYSLTSGGPTYKTKNPTLIVSSTFTVTYHIFLRQQGRTPMHIPRPGNFRYICNIEYLLTMNSYHKYH